MAEAKHQEFKRAINDHSNQRDIHSRALAFVRDIVMSYLL